LVDGHAKRRLTGRRRPPMCYTRKDRELQKESRRMTESRLMEKEARHRHEEHDRRRAKEEKEPLTEKVKEVVGVR
jgi:protein subunit release factor B